MVQEDYEMRRTSHFVRVFGHVVEEIVKLCKKTCKEGKAGLIKLILIVIG